MSNAKKARLWAVIVNGKMKSLHDKEASAIADCQEIGLQAELHEYHLTKQEKFQILKKFEKNFKRVYKH